MKILLFLSIFLFGSFFSKMVLSGNIYQWVDADGKRHFSDRAPNNHASVKFDSKALQSVVLVKTPKIRLKKLPKRKFIVSSRSKKCSALKKKISHTEKRLKKRLEASKSDLYSRLLKELRWEKIKSC